ncbi:hypothetical protein LWC35_18215 [Pseudonocardia kujensis]|uniref:hypothetical protein n=1 Tax=Pseudonocardia kujensis TaxID=1128675 RepID=UPI001E571897|nr:hypothetical protein [Pseudonocardia kujensis]MCE0764826.1 hypothetical protein [Pseudonocardia kujensis]
MTDHPGMFSPRIADMRQLLEDEDLNDTARRRIETAIEEIDTEWSNRKRSGYEKGIAERDRNHEEVLAAVGEFRDAVAQATDDVRNGRRPADDVRKWLRDVRADFDKLTKWHRGIEASEQRLTDVEAMTASDYQEAQFERFPLTMNGATTLGAKLAEYANRRPAHRGPRLSKAQIDAEQDTLLKELRRGNRQG